MALRTSLALAWIGCLGHSLRTQSPLRRSQDIDFIHDRRVSETVPAAPGEQLLAKHINSNRNRRCKRSLASPKNLGVLFFALHQAAGSMRKPSLPQRCNTFVNTRPMVFGNAEHFDHFVAAARNRASISKTGLYSRGSSKRSILSRRTSSNVSTGIEIATHRSKRLKRRGEFAMLLRLAMPDWRRLTAALFALVLAASGEALLPALKADALNAALGLDTGPSLRVALTRLGQLSVGLVLCTGIRGLLFFQCGSRLVARLRAQVFGKLLRKQQAFHDEQGPGELSTRIASDCEMLGDVLSMSMNVVLRQAIQSLIAVGIAVRINARLAGAVLTGVALRTMWSAFYSRATRLNAKRQKDALAAASGVAEQCMSLIKTVRAHGNEAGEDKRYMMELDKLLVLQRRRSYLFGSNRLVNGGLNMAALTGILALGSAFVARGMLPREALTPFMLYVSFISDASSDIADQWGRIQEARGAATKVFGYIKSPDGMSASHSNAVSAPLENDTHDTSGKRGALALHGVDFAYPSRPMARVTQNLSLTVRAGELVAIVGGSGSGKSTIFALALRFYKPSKGTIELDGVPLDSIDEKSLRSSIAWVQQEPPLFPGRTIRDNIAYGLQDISEKDIQLAAEEANAYEFIQDLPHGFDTMIGAAGASLSGGQKQRIALARALVRKPALLLLDEATSALDPLSQKLVEAAIRRARKRCTVLFTTHTVVQAKQADRIIVMSLGRIIEQGTHDELKWRGGAYAQLLRAGDEVSEEEAAAVISGAATAATSAR